MSLTVDRRFFLASGALALANAAINPRFTLAKSSEDIPKYEITEVIKDSSRIEDKYSAYYKVDIKNEGWFYIAQSKDCNQKTVFLAAHNFEDKRKGKVFPAPDDYSKPVAVVSAKEAGLSGVFEIYDDGENSYKIKYNFSPLLSIPSHTKVNSNYLISVQNGLSKIPEPLVDDLRGRGIRLMIGKNVEDTYYYRYPSWKRYDEENPNDPSKPWLEVKGDSCIDHRNYSNISALYVQKTVIMPQTHYEYGTGKLNDRSEWHKWNQYTVGHELGHAIDYFNSDDHYNGDSYKYSNKKKSNVARYSGVEKFLELFKLDKERMDPALRNKIAYTWCKKDGGEAEGFADLCAVMFGSMSSKNAAITLFAYPQSAEYVRKEILPKFGTNITVDDVRKNIYADYLTGKPLPDGFVKAENSSDIQVASHFPRKNPDLNIVSTNVFASPNLPTSASGCCGSGNN